MSNFSPEAITVTFYKKHGDSYAVTWQTESKGQPMLEYTDIHDTDFRRSTKVRGEAFVTSTAMYKNSAVIERLSPNDKVLYRVGDESGVFSAPAVLTSPPDDAGRSAFLLFTDTQDQTNRGAWWKTALDDAAKLFPDFGYIVHGGDIVQMSVEHTEWRDMLEFSSEYTRKRPIIAITGNHDYWKGFVGEHTGTFYDHFTSDLPPQNTSFGTYYSVLRGNMLICALSSGDAEETGSALLESQCEWLKNELCTTSARWKIVLIHNPLYSPGKYGSRQPIVKPCLELRHQLSGLLEDCGVDLVISGHDHMFARTYPVGAAMEPKQDCRIAEGHILERTAELFVAPGAPIHFIPACAGHQNRGIEDPHTEKQLSYFREMREMTGRETAYAAVEADNECMNILFRIINADSKECVFESAFGINKPQGS